MKVLMQVTVGPYLVFLTIPEMTGTPTLFDVVWRMVNEEGVIQVIINFNRNFLLTTKKENRKYDKR